MNKTFPNQLISSSYFTVGMNFLIFFLRELDLVTQEIIKFGSFLIQIFRLNEGRANLQGCPKHPSEINCHVCKVLNLLQVRKISPSTWIRSPDRLARSLSLYRLPYPAHLIYAIP
jgi:hypothetical protein